MAKKKGKSEGKNDDQQKNNNNNDGGKKDDIVTVVLKADLHCEGCADKVLKSIRRFEGVESVKLGDGDKNKVTVIGKVDPVKLRDKVEQKSKKKVELVSPLPKKDKDKDSEKKNDSGGGEKATEDKPEKKKSKEPPVTTAVLKVNLHCAGCIQKIQRIVSKTAGYQEMNIDRPKDLITVKGTMDMKALAESLKDKLKKSVEIVPPKKEGGGEKKGKGDGEQGKGKGKGGGGNGGGDGGGKPVENQVQVDYVQYGYPYPYPYVYGPGYVMNHNFHAPQIFSDENPNACSVM